MLHYATLVGVVAASLVVAPAYAKSQDTILLGAAVSLTGKYTTNGEHTQRGYDLAVKKINEAGGVKVGDKSYKLQIRYYDDESTPARGAELAERLIQQDGVKFMLGPYSSGMTKAIAPVTEEHKVPMVEANGASRSLFTNGWKYIFATLSTSEQYLASAVALVAENAKDLGKEVREVKVALAFENDPFSQDVRAGVLEDMKKFGMEVVIDDQLPRELNDMTATLTKAKALKPDMLIVSGHSKGAATAIRQISELKVKVPVLALTHCDAADVIGQFGEAAEYTLCATQWAPTLAYSDDLFGSAAHFAKLFEETYGYAPPYQAAESAAAVQVYADAFERAGSLDPQAVRDALAATDMKTFYGPIKFDDTGKNIAKPMALYQVLNGEYKVVAPSDFAETKAVIPRPSM
ncbi:amino acid ABC transporter substrate-binding protein [Bradyrhizobium icense]|uniref:Amino acid ABC transporter substrate-binding protein n=1 Tax=Bradyrhizobium icense TaxID=1274631 RepID=A0A1B1UDK1_9BRAD|nr:amino acid ABC transporter substrate-binding protein [Bradyrhizobium icense]ANW00850.1 amino acid ABC transporter substrate-binding protein [Bradyrhizobium icense]